ncbi:CHAD domain-containing protein [uncultured Photobacterium sp.]|uniref:CHAD domain-containing protein n=1 Tax=uncultured Photobacterium sp. TaxID=173973 RepID=UPI00260E8B35|nr:CHAD domain-containing protein [uncultured Photobacterium sp.]
MNVNKRDQLKLPKKKKPEISLSANADIYLPTFHFLKSEYNHARQHEKGIIRDDDVEFLHQYRVALRRSRALISLLKSLFKPEQKNMLKAELKTMMLETNLLRDLDVFLIKMDDYFSCLDHQYHQGLTCFFDELQHMRRKTHKELKKWLRSDNYDQQCQLVKGLIAELEFCTTAKGHAHSQDFGRDIIWKHFDEVQTLCNELTSNSPDQSIHELRICCKKLRYLLEYFSPIFPTKVGKEQIKHLKQLQDELGEFNDSSVQQHFFEHYLNDHPASNPSHEAISQLKAITERHHKETKKQVIHQIGLFTHPKNIKSYKALYFAGAK